MKMPSLLSLFLGTSLLTASIACPASAQGEKLALRILPVGDPPPFEQKFEGKVRVQKPLPLGALPPQQIAITNKDGGQVGAPLNLGLGQISRILPVTSGKVPLHELNKGAIEPRAFHTLKMPRAQAGLAIIWRDPKRKKWPHALSLTLPDDGKSFAAGKARIVNVSSASVRLIIEAPGKKKEQVVLPRGKFVQRAGTSRIEIKAPVNGKWKRVYAAVPLANKVARANLVVYNSDGIGADRFHPTKVHPLVDRVVNPKVPKPKE